MGNTADDEVNFYSRTAKITNNGEHDNSCNNVEFLFPEFFSSHQKLLLGIIYRPNNRIILNFTYTILIGDLNANILLDYRLHLINSLIPKH